MRKFFYHFALAFLVLLKQFPINAQIQIIFTADCHYGITRSTFRGSINVPAVIVNSAMVSSMNKLSSQILPVDGGVNQGNLIGGIDYLINAGDIANREEPPYQSASDSWAQFQNDFIDSIKLKDHSGNKTQLLMVPGNHDVSDAIGYYTTMVPPTDSTSMVNMYQLMMPDPRPTGNYHYANEKIHFSRNIGGIHFMFLSIWPDSAERIWMESDLANVQDSTPVLIFTHDPSTADVSHFTNPNGTHTINATDQFENLLLEVFKDGTINSTGNIEQREFDAFLKLHPNIKALFHGHHNENLFSIYTGPDKDVSLNDIDVDSPMKGQVSATDETMLSFQLISIDTITKNVTVRECLWNKEKNDTAPVVFGTKLDLPLTTITSVPSISGSSTSVSIIPNPTEGNILINTTSNETITEVEVYNLKGQCILNKQENSASCTVDLSSFSKGNYFVTVHMNNKVITNQIILK